MIDKIIEVEEALEILGVKKRLESAEKQIWTPSGVRTINGEEPDDLGNIEGYLKLDQATPQPIVNGSPINLSEPTFTYTAGMLTRISYPSGYKKNFTYNVDETLDEIDYNGEYTKKFNYTGGVLTSIST